MTNSLHDVLVGWCVMFAWVQLQWTWRCIVSLYVTRSWLLHCDPILATIVGLNVYLKSWALDCYKLLFPLRLSSGRCFGVILLWLIPLLVPATLVLLIWLDPGISSVATIWSAEQIRWTDLIHPCELQIAASQAGSNREAEEACVADVGLCHWLS